MNRLFDAIVPTKKGCDLRNCETLHRIPARIARPAASGVFSCNEANKDETHYSNVLDERVAVVGIGFGNASCRGDGAAF